MVNHKEFPPVKTGYLAWIPHSHLSACLRDFSNSPAPEKLAQVAKTDYDGQHLTFQQDRTANSRYLLPFDLLDVE